MRARPLVRMIGRNALRNRTRALTSIVGIVIGIGFFVLFLASTEQIGQVLAKVFPLDEVEVVAPQAVIGIYDGSKRLDDEIVAQIAARPEVVRAVPRMGLAFPATGEGTFEGQALSLKIDGSADGVDPSHVTGDPSLLPEDRAYLADLFQDWEDPARGAGPACVPPPPGQRSPCARPEREYCDVATRTCRHRVPVVLSPAMLQLYNTQFAKANRTPLIGDDLVKFMLERGGLERMRFNLELGGGATQRQRRVEAVLIGISNKAKPIGMTVPIQYIARWNREFVDEDAASRYSSIMVTLRQREDVAPFSQWLRDALQLRVEDSVGERLATVVLVMRVVLLIIAVVILLISAVGIAHTFFMLVHERRRELGLLRALGATRAAVRAIVLGEAFVLGLLGGILGVALALGLGVLVDALVGRFTPNFPFKPTTWSDFRAWMLLLGVGIGGGFALLGGFLPARRAARLEPAVALTGD